MTKTNDPRSGCAILRPPHPMTIEEALKCKESVPIVFMDATPESAASAALAVTGWFNLHPTASSVEFVVLGFDADPRELDEIPEAADALCIFATIVGPKLLNKFSLEQRAMLLVCMGHGFRKGAEFYVPSPPATMN